MPNTITIQATCNCCGKVTAETTAPVQKGSVGGQPTTNPKTGAYEGRGGWDGSFKIQPCFCGPRSNPCVTLQVDFS